MFWFDCGVRACVSIYMCECVCALCSAFIQLNGHGQANKQTRKKNERIIMRKNSALWM